MKLLVKIVAPAVVAVAAAATVAVAAPINPSTPYPDVPANADVCKVEKLEIRKAQAKYDLAKGNYDRSKRAYDAGVGSADQLRTDEAALHNAGIALNNAKYAEALCRNNKGNDPRKACISLSLELNRLIDELAMRQQLERIARENYDMYLLLARQGVAGAEQVAIAKAGWEVAVAEREQAEQKITDQRAALAADPNCRDYPSDRPTPTSTTPPPGTTTPPATTSPPLTSTTAPPTTG